ncbi:MAG: hypothetical protein AUJ92_20210 [Armatimonadetes bacterium CG2_30_59_28]|nr:YjgP/YjgQ family permease [Armatimonadota bacterium]OIO89936.1 MAG: hypothetical protein AUJ92_20210 [Armatimonadetes bacterium CG2_30_59_28]PIU66856.1 MAG: hypothetical protein COS85_02920 [Armatimonadetes bacterium CG07_land_8_20_14_0_80_59_28]PIX43770.1 MAG: hypothetical protein COZ56_06365 [Armatimonadetes bacterium CG_4_8_14_3_um_filter_58_9]PJB66280.1 MAG: hypothetical protein CO095_13210 [Armatimonadetes bacterium CG_4_9_14_3_um_filter_58_7]
MTKPLKDYPSTDLRQDLHQRSTIRRFLAYGTVLDRYLFRELILPFIVGVAAFLVIILGHTLYQIVDIVINRGVSAVDVTKMLIYRIPGFSILAIPVATLLAIALVVNRLERETEFTAMRGGGVSLPRLAVPCLLFGGLMTVLSYVLSEEVAPWANHRSENIVRKIMLTKSIPMVEENRYFSSGDFYFYVHEVDVALSELRDVMIYERQSPRAVYPRVITAKRAFTREGAWLLKDCLVHEFDEKGRLVTEASVDEVRFKLDLTVEDLFGEQRGPAEMPSAELKRQIDLFDRGGINVRKMKVDYFTKFSVPLAPCILGLLAFPISRRWARAGSFMGILVTVLLVFFYNGFMSWSSALGNGGILSPVLAAWFPNVFFGLLGIGFMWRER